MKTPTKDAAVRAMPRPFLDWQCEERRAVFHALQRGEMPTACASHLPVVSTLNAPGAPFPIHSCNKGVGLLPHPDLIEEHVALIRDCLDQVRGRPPRESLASRVAVALALYDHPERIDPHRFGAIEIFHGRTADNLARDPRAALLFTGPGPRYLSFQVNCEAERVQRDDPRFEFARGMRLLFEMDGFHIQQPAYEDGYLFHVQEVLDKTPVQLRCPHARRGARPQP